MPSQRPSQDDPDMAEQIRLQQRLRDQQQAGVPLEERQRTQQGQTTPHSILTEARALIVGDRHNDYGDAREDFEGTAKIWGVILGKDVSARQVAMCMVALKLRREAMQSKHDNRLDMIGYAALLEYVTND